MKNGYRSSRLLQAVAGLAVSVCFSTSWAGQSIDSLREEAAAGSKLALYNLGVRYGRGDGVKQDLDQAAGYYFSAAVKNYAPAQNNLGWAYRQGLGVAKDPRRAIFWFRLSALQGNALAIQNLAEMFSEGEGIKVNQQVADELFWLCAVQPMQESGAVLQSGINNAIHECRRSVAASILRDQGAGQDSLRRAALFLRASLNDFVDRKQDSEIGVRARRSAKETDELYRVIDKRLDKKSKEFVQHGIENWALIRAAMEDRTIFPLTVIDCEPSDIKI